MALHQYKVFLAEPISESAKPIQPGEPFPDVSGVEWAGYAESPAAATELARPEWKATFGVDCPEDAEVTVTPGPKVCEHCEGRGKEPRSSYGLRDPGESWPLGSALTRTCRECSGTGAKA
jgi:hypothetical protein